MTMVSHRTGGAPLILTILVAALLLGAAPAPGAGAPPAARATTRPAGSTTNPSAGLAARRQRAFSFTYAATVTGLEPGNEARVWMPVPSNDLDQDVAIERSELPADRKIGVEPRYGNRILFARGLAGADGTVRLSITYRVLRYEVLSDTGRGLGDKDEIATFLKPDALVPAGGKSLKLIEGKALPADPVGVARLFYDAVNAHMKYSKEGTGWGRGDAEWACDSRFGNCSDFHSLFISLARARQIPAKFEMGFPIPEKRGTGDVGGYHCWARFLPAGRGWIAVDISEANKHPELKDYYFGNLTPDRVAFSVGRDLVLEPKQDGPPLNFFIYPYVEVDGKPWPAEKVTKKFAYEDVP